MTALAKVLAWKFDNAPGIRTREVLDVDGNPTGVMEIFDWPLEELGVQPSQTEIDTWTAEFDALDHKGIEAALLLNRAIDLTFLDGHWITMRALAANAIVTGVAAVDAAVAASDRAAFDQFFADQVKARL